MKNILDILNTVAPGLLAAEIESAITSSPHREKIPHKVMVKMAERLSERRLLIFAPDYPPGFQFLGILEQGVWQKTNGPTSERLMAHEVDPPFGLELALRENELMQILKGTASASVTSAVTADLGKAAKTFLSASYFNETMGREHIYYTDGSYEGGNLPGNRLGFCVIETNAKGEITAVLYSQPEYFTRGDEAFHNHIAEICAVREAFRWIQCHGFAMKTVTIVCDNMYSAKTLAGVFSPNPKTPVVPAGLSTPVADVRWQHIYSHDGESGLPPSPNFFYNDLADILAGLALKPLPPEQVIDLIYKGESKFKGGVIPYRGTKLKLKV